MSTITETIQKIDEYLRERYGLHLFNDGATEEEIAEAERQIGILFPESLKELYRFANGNREEVYIEKRLGLHFLSLDDMIKEYNLLKDLIEVPYPEEMENHAPDFLRTAYFHKGWIPIIEDYCKNGAAIDLCPAERGKTGQIINYGRDEDYRYVLFWSLEEMVLWIWRLIHRNEIIINRVDLVRETGNEKGKAITLIEVSFLERDLVSYLREERGKKANLPFRP